MRDPLDELENFSTPGLTMNPIPASEVRRRGTRMRRRNHALAAIGGIAVVAIIATPLAMAATGGRTDTTPPPATQSPSPTVSDSATPSATWKREIPRSFPIAVDMPNGTQVDKLPAPTGLEVCGTEAVSVLTYDGRVRALASASYVGKGSSDTPVRTLNLFPDDAAASAALGELRGLLDSCPTDGNGAGATLVNEYADADRGDEGVDVTQQAHDGDLLYDLTAVQVTRTGNAVLVVSFHTSAGGQQVLDTEVQRLTDQSAPVVDAMCAFAAAPC